jgi:hypothetical protein
MSAPTTSERDSAAGLVKRKDVCSDSVSILRQLGLLS